jgi:hypothetical protein
VSTPGKGTRFTFSWPVSAFDSLIDLGAESRHAAA